MPSKNKTNKGRHSPEQQPSLLDQIELDEEQAYETQAPENHLPEEPGQESPGHGDGADQRSAEPEAKTADPQLPEYEERHAPPEQPSEPLKSAYDRYVEIVGATYSSTFSDAKRQAAFKEAGQNSQGQNNRPQALLHRLRSGYPLQLRHRRGPRARRRRHTPPLTERLT